MKLLLHVCCGPCGMYPQKVLRERGIDFDAYFYNPNIHPKEEFEKRKKAAIKWADIFNIKMYISKSFETKPWLELKDQKDKRCNMCYTKRIKESIRFAKENGYTHVTSTLFVSPYQKHDLMKEKFEYYADKYGIKFLYIDFREGFRQGNRLAKEKGLYTQRYCGCIPSYYESDIIQKKLRKKEAKK